MCLRVHIEEMSDQDHETPPSREPAAPFGAVGYGARLVGRQVLALLGLFLIILSIPIGFLTPAIPVGLPIGLFGSALLARNSVWGRRFIRYLINRFPKLEKIIPVWLDILIFGKKKAD